MPASPEPASQPSSPRPVEAIHTEPGDGRPRIRIATPKKLLSLVPYLLGFHPEDSVVILGGKGEHGSPGVTLRVSLDELVGSDHAASGARTLAVILAQQCTSATVVGYGTDDRVTPFALQFRDLAPEKDIQVLEILRVEGGRYWSYCCTDPACCPPEGTPYQLSDNPELARLLPEGTPGLLASRRDLAALVAPVTGTEAATMRRATKQAEAHITELLNREPQSGQPSGRALVIAEGIKAVQAALARFKQGGDLTRAEAARLTVTLREIQVRDDFWSRLAPSDRKHNLRLLLELTRLARPAFVAPVATLLAFTAWQCGNGALAHVALDRALADRPEYSMAEMIREAVTYGLSPELAKPPCTPEEVAALYAERATGKSGAEAGAATTWRTSSG